ncbi:FMN-dependent NADH-azoreductase [Rhizobium straminoryzae]|uniref:FMN dependent NADH:quinone oxidoreductase n=1 Tax=Rhizobium straminoryzae TaxID=1387186 RepID=A0A549T139_9HYPH|nr:NAD(P)H-dependent oxidoreductase [Rhizobium straminoryzae]TRL35586.1 FMN-dependent NADH-azoreductase [Rhizobium straminoryzae]
MKILHIDSSILGASSITRDLTATIIDAMRTRNANVEIEYLDLVEDPISHMDGAVAAGFRPNVKTEFDAAALHEKDTSDRLVAQFLASDVIVIGAPMYNFSVPTQLKAWLDRIAQPGKTFKYTETGPIGLADGKRVIIASGRGGFYLEGPLVQLDFQESYLKAFFGFLGIHDVRFVRAEGASRGEEIRQKGIASAKAAIAAALVAA